MSDLSDDNIVSLFFFDIEKSWSSMAGYNIIMLLHYP